MPIYQREQLNTIAFPLGGIGAGCVSLAGNGSLTDWELFHRPNKQNLMPNTFFALWTRTADGATDARVLQSRTAMPHIGQGIGENFTGFGFGVRRETGAGLKHYRRSTFRGEYPFAWVTFDEPNSPAAVTLMAYNPYIPLNVEESGIPAAIFEYTITNTSAQEIDISLAGNLFNAVGYRGYGEFNGMQAAVSRGTGNRNRNQFVRTGDLSVLLMNSEVYTPDVPYGGTMTLATPWQHTTQQTTWLRAAWFDTLQAFWDEFSSVGRLTERVYDEPSAPGSSDTGSLIMHAHLAPGESVAIPVYLCWHFPNFIKYWESSYEVSAHPVTWRVPYAARFMDALDVAGYLGANESRLRAETQRFHDALFGSTLPPAVIDAVSSQLSTLKTPTVTLLEDGSFYGWEGVHSTAGSCEGSCLHVWNYALTHAYLFPSLERSMRSNAFHYAEYEDGRMAFRLSLPLGAPKIEFHPAADGQMGNVMQMYRDWKISGDTEWLRGLWGRVKLALEYAWQGWDYNVDGVMEGLQHNTYDIEFYGPNSMMQTWYLGALRCAAEMAQAVGDPDAEKYTRLYEQGCAWTDANLFNGSYYEQKIDPEAAQHSPISTHISMGGQREGDPKYQYGAGCLSDQVIGAWMARVCGLGNILNPANTRTTLEAIYRHNFRTSLDDHNNAQRIYAWGDEGGLLLCTWPRGGRPNLPFVYSDEVWTGIEYQVAGHMIYEGMIEEGLKLVETVRSRYDGAARNPWNELECGSHYARALASWGVLLALSGFTCDLTVGHLGFAPALDVRPFKCFWSTGTAWGTYTQTDDSAALDVLYGEQVLQSWRIVGNASALSLDHTYLAAVFTTEGANTLINLATPITLREGARLMAR